MNDKPVMQTPGEKLAALRNAAGRSLPDLSEATKIPLPMLKAIELDEYHKISGDLYVKSFLRAYACEVGLDAEEILTLYGNYSGEGGGVPGSPGAAVWQEEEVQIKRLGLPWGTIAIAAAGLVLIAVTAYFLLRDGSDDASPEPAVQPAAVETSDNSEVVVTPEIEAQLVESPVQDTEPPVAVPVEVPVQAEGLPADPIPEGSALAIDGLTWPVVLRLVCPDARSISLKKDGERLYDSVIWPTPAPPLPAAGVKSGRAYQTREGLVIYWGAEDHFSLRVDNPAGVKATLNGGYRDISGLGRGAEIILNDPAVINSNLPSARSADRP